jgi:hypothetical protein
MAIAIDALRTNNHSSNERKPQRVADLSRALPFSHEYDLMADKIMRDTAMCCKYVREEIPEDDQILYGMICVGIIQVHQGTATG